MMFRTTVAYPVLILGIITLILIMDSAIRADDFSLNLAINGEDIFEEGTITIDSERELIIDLRIFDVTSDIILSKYSITVTFAGVSFPPISEQLGNYHMAPGDSYQREITINAREFLKLHDIKLNPLWDEQKKVVAKYDIAEMPTTIIIDKNGVIRQIYSGFDAEQYIQYKQVIQKLLREPSANSSNRQTRITN